MVIIIRVGLAAHSYVFRLEIHPLVWTAVLTHMSSNPKDKWDILVACFTDMATGTRHHVWQCLIRVITGIVAGDAAVDFLGIGYVKPVAGIIN